MADLTSAEAVVDGIYEAAIVAERWPSVLGRLCELVDASAAGLLTFDVHQRMDFVVTPSYRGVFESFAANGDKGRYDNQRPRRALASGHLGFQHDLELFTQEELEADALYRDFIYPHGVRWTAGSVVPVPTGDIVVFDFARQRKPFERADMERLDLFRPHLARAGLLAHRLGLQAARSATQALAAVGLPAAALSADGRVLSANPLLLALADRIRIGAHDRIHLLNRRVNTMVQVALERAAGTEPAVQSIPMPATATGNAAVLHIVPIRRAAQDIFSTTTALLVITEVTQPDAPLTSILTGLFDLTPAEARVAQGLSAGLSITELAEHFGTSRETVRAQTKSIYRKTGTDGQSSLLLLLQGARPLGKP